MLILNQSELEALDKLVHELGYLPLALEQAGAYIYENNSSFKDYLSSYKKRGLKLLEKSPIDKRQISRIGIYHLVLELREGKSKLQKFQRIFYLQVLFSIPSNPS